MDRRKFLTKSTLATAGAAVALTAKQAQASGKHHGKHHGSNKYQQAVKASLDCIGSGEVCASHCVELLSQGDKSMKDCLPAVRNMLALCGAMVKVGSAGTNKKLIQKTAAACVMACEACMNECDKHKDKHADCKVCYESCKRCIAACKKIA